MNTQLATQVAIVIEQLRVIHAELSGESLFPEERYALIENGLCLHCGEPIAEGAVKVRECHESCRHRQKRDKTKTDAYWVSKGLLAPTGKTGRKPSNRIQEETERSLSITDAKAARKKHDK